MQERAIIHLNIADFAVAVERVVESRLRGRPVLIAPECATRATIYDMSDEAYRAGVRKGMALRRARRLCPDAELLEPHPERYERAMRAFLKETLPYSPLVEAADGNGHLFVDASGTSRLHGPPPDIAWRIRTAMKRDYRLDPIWSVAPNKLMAKVATRLVKPNGEYIVSAGEEPDVLAPLPVRLLPGVEPRDRRGLEELCVRRVGDLARWDLWQLDVAFGKRSRHLYEAARGVDPSPVLPVGQRPPTVAAEHAFGDDSNDRHVIEGVVYALIERMGFELRARRLAARRLILLLDYSDGVRVPRQCALTPASADDRVLYAAALRVLALAWVRRVRIRHVRLSADRLVYPPAQLELFSRNDERDPRHARLSATFDEIRRRYGANAVRVGRTLNVTKTDAASPFSSDGV